MARWVAGDGIDLSHVGDDLIISNVDAASAQPVALSVTFGDGQNELTTDWGPYVCRLPVALTWGRWDIQADQTGDVVIDVQRATDAAPNTFASIAGTSKPTLATDQDNSDTDLTTGWGDDDTDAGDRIKILIESAATVTWVAVHFELARTP